jgi:prevent-host-death family protein
MSKRVPLEQLPRKVERLLSAAWEGRESVVLERNGEPVAAVVPMADYRRLHPASATAPDGKRQAKKKTESCALTLAYELPADLLAAYHRLLDKKFSEGLTPDEETELARVDRELGEADMATPLEQSIDARARREHERRMTILNDIIEQLKSLQQPE